MRIHSAAIHYFEAVRRAGSIREAARRLNVASSAVNRQILKLEEEVGVPLFERRAHGVTLTAAGELLARHVITVLQDLERARSDILALQGARVGHVEIAAVEGVCAGLLPGALERLRAAAPAITVGVQVMGSAAIPRALTEGAANLGVAFNLVPPPELREVQRVSFKLGAVMAPGHALAAQEAVTLAQCAAYPLIFAGEDLSIAGLMRPSLGALGRRLTPAITASSVDLIGRLAMAGLGIGFQTPLGLEQAIAEGRAAFRPLDAKGPIWSDLSVTVRAGQAQPAPVELFLRLLAEEMEQRSEAAPGG